MTHCEQALEFMRAHGSITPADALGFRPHACTRLAARISDLKYRGHVIDTVIETRQYEDGSTTRNARYYLKEANDGTTA